jgi:hypothetical protein
MKAPILAISLSISAIAGAHAQKPKPAAPASPVQPAVVAQPSEAGATRKEPLVNSDAPRPAADAARPATEPPNASPERPSLEGAKIGGEIAKPVAETARTTAEPARAKLPLISTDVNGRDITFIRGALDLEKTATWLAKEAGRTGNKELEGFCAELVRTLVAQGSVLSTLAEMKNIAVTPVSPRQQQIEERLAKLTDEDRDKALVQAFIETDNAIIATYEIATKSTNSTIQILGEQALPHAREHLILVQAMASGSTKLPPIGQGPKTQESPKPANRPAFRTNVPAPDKAP